VWLKNNRQQFKEEKKKGWIHMGNNDSSVETFLQWIKASDNIVFFGGAGVSTESGIPDFRSVDGLYNQKYDYPPETILSHTFYRKHPQEFYRFYRDKMLCLDAEPNITHYKLAELEKAGKLKGVVTQNIDGLHQKAGSKNVMELHGSVLRNYCERCLQFVSAEEILHSTDVPKCPKCGGPVKPDVVLYEEGLNQKTLEDAIYYISHADVLIVGGTSLAVYPAAGLIDYYNGNKLVLINKSTTPMDARADLLIQQGLGSVFEQIEVQNIF
jgi:NAD-dependent deacetylase